MITDNNKHMITNEIAYISQLFFLYVTFLSTSEVLVVSNISSSHANINLPYRRFFHEQLLVSKYLLILHALLHSQSNVLGFHT